MNKNVLIITIFMIFSTIVSWSSFFGQYSQKDTVNIHLFPGTIGEWSSREIPISNSDYAILETNNAFSRIYRSPEGEEIMLFSVYSQNNRKVSHPPEICYTGSGAAILNKTRIDLDLGPKYGQMGMERLTAQIGKTKFMVYYCFKAGNSFTPNYWKQQVMLAIKTLLGQPVSSAMVRLTVGFNGADTLKSDRLAQKFMRLILPDVTQYLP